MLPVLRGVDPWNDACLKRHCAKNIAAMMYLEKTLEPPLAELDEKSAGKLRYGDLIPINVFGT